MLAALPAVTALAGSALRLPRTQEVEVDPHLTDPNHWNFTKVQGFSNRLSTAGDLNEQMLEDIVKQLNELTDKAAFLVRPTKLIVHPHMASLAQQIIEHRPGFLERLWWRLMPAP